MHFSREKLDVASLNLCQADQLRRALLSVHLGVAEAVIDVVAVERAAAMLTKLGKLGT